MSFISRIQKRTYFRKLLLSTVTIMVVTLVLSMLSLYLFSESKIIESQRMDNEKVLSQIDYNIISMQDMVKNFAVSLYLNTDYVPLIEGQDIDPFLEIKLINKLNSLIGTTTFIDSIIIYNGMNHSFYPVNGSGSFSQEDALVQAVRSQMNSSTQLNKMQFVPLWLTDKGKQGMLKVFSLYLYKSNEIYKKGESALIVNIRPDWLLNNIKLLYSLTESSPSEILVFDQNQQLLNENKMVSMVDNKQLLQDIRVRGEKSGKALQQYVSNYDSEKKLVSYIVNETNHWTIVNIQPYGNLLGTVNRIKLATFIVCGISLLLALIASVILSAKFYGPIQLLIQKITPMSDGNELSSSSKDEIGYISSMYDNVLLQLQERRSSQSITGRYLTLVTSRRLLIESANITEGELTEWEDQGIVPFSKNSSFVVALLHIDGYKEHERIFSSQERRLYVFAISNIMHELLSESFFCLVVEAGVDHLAAILTPKEAEQTNLDKLTQLLGDIQRILKSYYNLSLTATVSPLIETYRKISAAYSKALDDAQFRLVLGKQSIITPDIIRLREREKEGVSLNEEQVNKLYQSVLSIQRNEFEVNLTKIFHDLKRMDEQDIRISLLQINGILRQAIGKRNENALVPVFIDLKKMSLASLELDTLDEIYDELLAIFESLSAEQKLVPLQKHHALVEVIEQVVEERYFDPNLSLQAISDLLKMSAAYVGRLYRKETGIAVSELIVSVRLNVGVRLLESKKYSIQEIVEHTGFGSVTYFHKLFKKKYGVTPKEYQIKRAIIDEERV